MTYANKHLLRCIFYALLAGVILAFVLDYLLP
jgi:hypothetical protein